MPRSGVEAKPPWREIPRDVRRAVGEALGSPVARSTRVWGGYGPAPTFRLRCADGRRAFLKAVGPVNNEFSRAAIVREARIYRELGDIIARWAPAFLGYAETGAWRAMLLEDLGPRSVPPWTPAATRHIFLAYADFHRSTLGSALPPWLPQPGRYLHGEAAAWERLIGTDDLAAVADLAGEEAADALGWLREAAPRLSAAAEPLARSDPPYALLHGDTRSDNLRWTRGRLCLFDWPHAGIGPAEFDLAAFAQSVAVEGGPEPERLVAWYGERGPVREDVLDAAVAAIAGFFADSAWRPDIPGLPRLRSFQRDQLRVSLAWAARRLRLPTPDWIASLPR